MRISVSVGSAYYNGDNFGEIVEYVMAADRMGLDSVWSAEAWGMEAVSSLGYLAAKTNTIRLGTGIMQISARTPAMTAMTALSLAQISDDRFNLGLGVSGPQVVEGLHGDAFAKPLSRLREYIDIVRMGINGQRMQYSGERYVLPRPGGECKAPQVVDPAQTLPAYLSRHARTQVARTHGRTRRWLARHLVRSRPRRRPARPDPCWSRGGGTVNGRHRHPGQRQYCGV